MASSSQTCRRTVQARQPGGAGSHVLLRRIGPAFLAAFTFRGRACHRPDARRSGGAEDVLRGDRRRFPEDLPRGFVRPGRRTAVFRDGAIDPQGFELCFFAELRDRLRAGDIWVEGGRQYRAVETSSIPGPSSPP